MLNIINKNLKSEFKSILNIFLIIAFMLQLFGMNIISEQFAEANTISGISGFVETIILGKFSVVKISQGYAAALISIFILFMGGISIGKLASERDENTLMRIYASPIKKMEILFSYLISTGLFVMLVVAFLMIFCKTVMNIEWGSSLGGLFLLVFSGVFVSVSMGLVSVALFKTSKSSIGVFAVIIVVMTFFSAPFDPYRTGRIGISALIQKITLNHWLHAGFVEIMSGKSYFSIIKNVLFLITVGIFMLTIAFYFFRKENFYE